MIISYREDFYFSCQRNCWQVGMEEIDQFNTDCNCQKQGVQSNHDVPQIFAEHKLEVNEEHVHDDHNNKKYNARQEHPSTVYFNCGIVFVHEGTNDPGES